MPTYMEGRSKISQNMVPTDHPTVLPTDRGKAIYAEGGHINAICQTSSSQYVERHNMISIISTSRCLQYRQTSKSRAYSVGAHCSSDSGLLLFPRQY